MERGSVSLSTPKTVSVRRDQLSWLLGRASELRQRMGDAEENRLLGLSVQDILSRLDILVDRSGTWAARSSSMAHIAEQLGIECRNMGLALGTVCPGMPGPVLEPSRSVLKAINEKPSADELADLSFVDQAFRVDPEISRTKTAMDLICEAKSSRTCRSPESRRGRLACTLSENPFFCPPMIDLEFMRRQDSSGMPWMFLPGGGVWCDAKSRNSIDCFFALDRSKPWGETKQILKNIASLAKLSKAYPWPAIANMPVASWALLERNGLLSLVREPGPLTQDAVRFFVTLSLYANWGTLAERARDYIKDKAKREKFKLIVLGVAVAAFGALTALAIPALIAKGFAAAAAAVSNEQKKDAVASLKAGAEALQSEEPGFAGQLAWAGDFVEAMILYPDAHEVGDVVPAAPGTGPSGAVKAVVGIGVPAILSAAMAAIAGS